MSKSIGLRAVDKAPPELLLGPPLGVVWSLLSYHWYGVLLFAILEGASVCMASGLVIAFMRGRPY